MIDLRLGDCLELMKSLPDASVDAVITDPPYGMKDHNMRNCAAFMDMSWDIKVDDSLIYSAISKGRNAIIFGGNYYALPPRRGFIVWDKGESIYGRSWAECEMAWTNYDKVARIFKLNPNNKGGKEHPTQKPIELMMWVVANYTQLGNTILDPFMGSGTTGVACVKLGRSFIGYEISPECFAIAQRRIAEAQMQMTMDLTT